MRSWSGFDKHHTMGRFRSARWVYMRDTGPGARNPTFVAFTPLDDDGQAILDFLRRNRRAGSGRGACRAGYRVCHWSADPGRLAAAGASRCGALVGDFNPQALVYPWSYLIRMSTISNARSPRSSGRQAQGMTAPRPSLVSASSPWLAGSGASVPSPAAASRSPIPQVSEPWYCCAEPLDDGLTGCESGPPQRATSQVRPIWTCPRCSQRHAVRHRPLAGGIHNGECCIGQEAEPTSTWCQQVVRRRRRRTFLLASTPIRR